MTEDNKKPKLKVSKASLAARQILKDLIDPLADLADAGDEAVINLLLDFGSLGKQLLETAVIIPGEPCTHCGVIHGVEDAPEDEAENVKSDRIIN